MFDTIVDNKSLGASSYAHTMFNTIVESIIGKLSGATPQYLDKCVVHVVAYLNSSDGPYIGSLNRKCFSPNI